MTDRTAAEDVVAEAKAAIDLADRMGVRGSHSSNIYNITERLADAITALLAERDEARENRDSHQRFAIRAMEALKPLADLYIGVSMDDDAPAAFTVLGRERDGDRVMLTAGDVRRARASQEKQTT